MLKRDRITDRSKQNLVLILLVIILLFVVLAWLFTQRAVTLSHDKGFNLETGDVYVFAMSYTLLLYVLTTLPLLMVVGYQGLQRGILTHKVAENLALCGLEDKQLFAKMQEYQNRNSFSAFLLPMLVNLIFLYLIWGAALFPWGVEGMMGHVEPGSEIRLGISITWPVIAKAASPIVWVLLGAYFYSISVIIRRWIQSDLTTNVLWKINVRLAVAFILGMLVTKLFSAPDLSAKDVAPYLAGFAFLIGIVPDMLLRWVSRQVKRVANIDGETTSELFAPTDLQKKIDGMSFWQLDRLAEEGIESVQDLAMKDIPSLLVRTRFDTPLLLSWVDRALLCNQAGGDIALFKRAHMVCASDLVRRARREHGIDEILQSLRDARQTLVSSAGRSGNQKPDQAPVGSVITQPVFENILVGLENGPNLRYLRNYWASLNKRSGVIEDITLAPRDMRKDVPAVTAVS